MWLRTKIHTFLRPFQVYSNSNVDFRRIKIMTFYYYCRFIRALLTFKEPVGKKTLVAVNAAFFSVRVFCTERSTLICVAVLPIFAGHPNFRGKTLKPHWGHNKSRLWIQFQYSVLNNFVFFWKMLTALTGRYGFPSKTCLINWILLTWKKMSPKNFYKTRQYFWTRFKLSMDQLYEEYN